MKTSFYFFLWIIIYPLLGLLHNPWVDQNSFIIALFFVWGLSWFLNRSMPDTIRYEKTLEMSEILEEVYSSNTKAFIARLSRMTVIDFITAIYFGVTFVFILFSMVRGSADDWVALLIFGFFSFAAISRAFKLNYVYRQLRANPSPEECMAVAQNFFHLDYSSYYEVRKFASPEAMRPAAPPHFKMFQIFSLVIAILCTLCGIYYLITAIMILSVNASPEVLSAGIMYFLYGSLAAYFGIKDCVTCFNLLKKKKIKIA